MEINCADNFCLIFWKPAVFTTVLVSGSIIEGVYEFSGFFKKAD